MGERKTCSECEEEKPSTDFPWRSKKGGKRRGQCKPCYNAKRRDYRRRRAKRKRATFDPSVIPDEKECSQCGVMKPSDEFYIRKTMSDGLGSMCKDCKQERNQEYKVQMKQEFLEGEREPWPEKECNGCGKTKPRAEFNLSRRDPSGLTHKCKDCLSEALFQRREEQGWTYIGDALDLPDEYKFCPQCHLVLPRVMFFKSDSRCDGVSWACSDCMNRRQAEYYRQNPDKQYEQYRRQYEANREYYIEKGRRRRALRLEVTVEEVDRLEVFERDGGICQLCGGEVGQEEFELDHVVPLSKGGEHSMANVQVAHMACNRSKGDALPTS